MNTPPKPTEDERYYSVKVQVGGTFSTPAFPNLEVVRLLGRGGYGEVYEVKDRLGGESYALKIVQMKQTTDPLVLERARQEGRTLMQIKHVNVVKVHECSTNEADGSITILMDLLRGETLHTWMAKAYRLPIAWTLRVAVQIAGALKAIHMYAIHRDIKPENIHLDPTTELVTLFDLGAGKSFLSELRTTKSFSIGTFPFMAAERLTSTPGVEPDHRVDLFSFGVVLYLMLSGHHPFWDQPWGKGEVDFKTVGGRILLNQFRPLRQVVPAMPIYLENIVHKLLAADRDQRYPDAATVERFLLAAARQFEKESVHDSYPMMLLQEEVPSLSLQTPRPPGGTAPPAPEKASRNRYAATPAPVPAMASAVTPTPADPDPAASAFALAPTVAVPRTPMPAPIATTPMAPATLASAPAREAPAREEPLPARRRFTARTEKLLDAIPEEDAPARSAAVARQDGTSRLPGLGRASDAGGDGWTGRLADWYWGLSERRFRALTIGLTAFIVVVLVAGVLAWTRPPSTTPAVTPAPEGSGRARVPGPSASPSAAPPGGAGSAPTLSAPTSAVCASAASAAAARKPSASAPKPTPRPTSPALF
jgi:serine/threonine protein kinase